MARQSVTASVSTPIDKRQVRQRIGRSPDTNWQEVAWSLYRSIGELRFAARYIANSFAQLRFMVATIDRPGARPTPIPDDPDPDNPADDGREPPNADDAAMRDAFERVRGRDGTLGSLLRVYGVQQFVAGESYLVGSGGLQSEEWEFLSTSELRRETSEYLRVGETDSDKAKVPDDALIIRCWHRDPQYRERADSSVRACIDVCEALRTSLAIMIATDRSRIASAGLLLVPAEAELPRASRDQGQDDAEDLPRLLDDMLDAMEEALDDPGSSSATIPILVEMKHDLIKEVTHLTFARAEDATIIERTEHLMDRLAMGLDIPPEKIKGVGESSNHWSAWNITEDTITAHVTPMALNFCEDMTRAIIQPTAEALGLAGPERYVLMHDTSDLITAPNREPNAQWAYEHFLLSGAAALDVMGFSTDQMPNDEEINQRIRIAIATGATASAGQLTDNPVEDGPTPAPAAPPAAPPAEPAPDDEVPDDSEEQTDPPPKDGPPTDKPNSTDRPKDTKPPSRRKRTAAALDSPEEVAVRAATVGRAVGMVDSAVWRAVERAGSKVLTRATRSTDLALRQSVQAARAPDVCAVLGPERLEALGFTVEQLLDGAWDDLRARLVPIVGNHGQVADRLIVLCDSLARRRLFEPTLPVAEFAEPICAAAIAIVHAPPVLSSTALDLDLDPDDDAEERIPAGVS